MLTRPWSHVSEPAFLRLVGEMRTADATLVNLETVIRDGEGWAESESGGNWMSSPPAIAEELKWAGVDLLAHANNHAFDYGSAGVLATRAYVEAAGLVLAGSGRDLEAARAARSFERDGRRIALVAMTATFVPWGKASRSRPEQPGRPGVNPLELEPAADREGASWLARAWRAARGGSGRPTQADVTGNLGALREAAVGSDLTIASIHAHARRGWLEGFARAALAAGADIVLRHGPHRIRGIELVDGRPVFYGLGDFAYQVEGIARHPSEAYARLGLAEDASHEELLRALRERSLAGERFAYQGCAAALRFEGRRLAELRLLPLDLQFDAEDAARGRPRWADPPLARAIIERIARRSARFGTRVIFDAAECQGRVVLDQGRERSVAAPAPAIRAASSPASGSAGTSATSLRRATLVIVTRSSWNVRKSPASRISVPGQVGSAARAAARSVLESAAPPGSRNSRSSRQAP